jgi:hypothetical protein
MATLTPTPVLRAGIAKNSVAASAGGDTLTNTGKEWIEVDNASGGALTVTISATIDGTLVALQAVSVPATTGHRKIGPFPPHLYGTAVAITYSGVTSLTIGAYSLSAY